MTCWLIEEYWETALELLTEGCIMLADRMLISILFGLVEPLEILCAEAVDALAPLASE